MTRPEESTEQIKAFYYSSQLLLNMMKISGSDFLYLLHMINKRELL